MAFPRLCSLSIIKHSSKSLSWFSSRTLPSLLSSLFPLLRPPQCPKRRRNLNLRRVSGRVAHHSLQHDAIRVGTFKIRTRTLVRPEAFVFGVASKLRRERKWRIRSGG
ncbi:Protein of unknown function [Pyronema omphalodes CBS 100304]|uniref:Uncharacterized protein n=1 Tax=Pyronema omphalodes (strain CBS 100304) TaxID=1076935 RepID=U4LJJ8_PYROM|nr:Protein of unknown function [Pyronema omphalodes CBS 100304]